MGVMMDLFKKGNYVDTPYHNFFEIRARDINKNHIQMRKFLKNIILVVNVSPLDPKFEEEYEKLIKLKNDLKGENFEILAFPSTQIDKVELSDREMKEKLMSIDTVRNNLNSVRLFNRVYLNGEEISDVFKYCYRNSSLFMYREGKSRLMNENFSKFLISKDGKVYNYFPKDTDIDEIEKNVKFLSVQREQIDSIRDNFINFNKNY
jgi:glutathione peroxidase